MWTCVTIIYLIPAMILTTRLLAARSSQEDKLGQKELHGTLATEETRKLWRLAEGGN
jgi:hypothetical protein